MALLELARKEQVFLIVAHVNYNKRPSAFRDQQIVERYCRQYNIPCEILNPTQTTHENFQAWARKVRYQFFATLLQKYEADFVLVGHHQDDLIETYLMQKSRKGIPETYGLNQCCIILGSKIIRPLLHYSKQNLIDYCRGNNIEYGIDESNLEDCYERNRIRHQKVEKLTQKERKQIVQEIKERNVQVKKERLNLAQKLQPILSMEKLQEVCEPVKLLSLWVKTYGNVQLSQKASQDILKQLKTSRNCEISLSNYVKLSKMYNQLEITQKIDVSYCYVLDRIEMLKTPYFTISETGEGTEAVTLSESDFPITIRNAHSKDAIALRFGTKKLSRWFIDRKVPHDERKSWPVVLNAQGEIILIPKIGSNCKHYSNTPTCFVVK